MSAETERVAVIGAGPAGLAAGAALRAAGIPFTIFERHIDVGGLWDLDNPGTPVYETAHFISSRTLSAFDGFPFPEDYPDYPSQRQILAYLRAYADHHDLRPHIRFGSGVRRAAAEPGGGWSIELEDGAVEQARWLVAANGHLWDPNLPSYPGEFHGEAYHSVDYRSPEQFRGRRVLVVGAGNSGVDIACDAAVAADEAAISLRRGYWFVPKHVFGVPADVIGHGGPTVPAAVERTVIRWLLRLMVGDLRRYGLPAPDHAPLSSHPILNTQLLHYLGHGDVSAKPDIAELCGDKVRFTDGSMGSYDTIVWATGYHPTVPFLESGVPWRNGAPDLFLQFASRGDDGLYVMGMYETDGGAYPLLSLQGRVLAGEIGLQRRDPSAAGRLRALHATSPDLRGGRRYLDSERHSKYVHGATYAKRLRAYAEALSRGEIPTGL
jgi:cation diffusion facilitator CzcD-associated flavoprotein CzcO